MLNCSQDFQYSNSIMYFLVHTLNSLTVQGLARLEEFSEKNKNLLDSSPN
jgi:hypothetical protein